MTHNKDMKAGDVIELLHSDWPDEYPVGMLVTVTQEMLDSTRSSVYNISGIRLCPDGVPGEYGTYYMHFREYEYRKVNLKPGTKLILREATREFCAADGTVCTVGPRGVHWGKFDSWYIDIVFPENVPQWDGGYDTRDFVLYKEPEVPVPIAPERKYSVGDKVRVLNISEAPDHWMNGASAVVTEVRDGRYRYPYVIQKIGSPREEVAVYANEIEPEPERSTDNSITVTPVDREDPFWVISLTDGKREYFPTLEEAVAFRRTTAWWHPRVLVEIKTANI